MDATEHGYGQEENGGVEDSCSARPRPRKPAIHPFVGRIGANQEMVLDRSDPENSQTLKKVPDAAPLMSIRDGFDLEGFLDLDLWRFGLIEGIAASMILVFSTVWLAALSPSAASPPQNTPAGVFATTNFLAPLMGGIGNILILTLLIFTFSSTSGSQINPMITLATFFARLISFPRMTIYIGCQTLGAALAGLMLTTAYGSRDFLTGGCVVNTELVPVKDAFVLEFMFCLMLIFISFGVGLDPRQAQTFGPALSPWLVGLGLGVTSWSSAYTRAGYAGASMNPARCFGAYVATEFPGYHWIHWVILTMRKHLLAMGSSIG
ncbi:hypothetical protein BBP40_002398 [Aspergillus hancockii]|nr:hypothetical protein BBP40_002398 [Aspergillus hancockii]